MKKKELFSRLYYHQMNRILYEMDLIRELKNPGDKGREAEEILRGFFKDIFPQKWGISTGYAISMGNITTQIDIMIHDKQNFPRIYNGYLLEIIPLMSLHIALEVKMELTISNLKEANEKAFKIKKMHSGDISLIGKKENLDDKQFYTSLFTFGTNCTLENIRKNLVNQNINGLDLIFIMNEGILIMNKDIYARISHDSMMWTGNTFDGFEVTKNHKLMAIYLTYILNRMKDFKIIDIDYQGWQTHDSLHEDVFED